MQHTHNTLDLLIREQSVVLLNLHLAAAIDLQAQMKQAHWNVRGPGFFAMHELFDAIATVVANDADKLAERCAALGGAASGTVQAAAAQSFMVPYPLTIAETQKHVFAVTAALAAFSQSTREAAATVAGQGDPATADLFTEITREIDQQLWFVESHANPS